jgi:hypothetical protein
MRRHVVSSRRTYRRSQRCCQTPLRTHSAHAACSRTHTSSRACCTAHPPPQAPAQTHSTARSCLSSRAHSIRVRSSSLSDADAASVANSTVSARLFSLVSSRCRVRRLGLVSPLEITHRRSYEGRRSSVNVRYWRAAILDRRHHHQRL